MGLYLLVSGDFTPWGGMDCANHALAGFLARRGDEVHLVAHRVSDDLVGFPNVVWHRVPKPANAYILGSPLLDRIGRHWARRIAARRGRVVVNGGNCQWGDVNWVHYVHAAYTPEVAGGWARRAMSRWRHRVYLQEERRAFKDARVIIANSQRTRRDLIDYLDVPEGRIEVVYYGTDPAKLHPASSDQRQATRRDLGWPGDRPLVAFVGALGDRRKGFDTLLTAWAAACASPDWPADLVVMGAGRELKQWRSRVVQAGLDGRVRFLGFRNDVPEVLAACDAIVAPTRYEAFGLGVQEALCRGLPAIVSRDAGVAERYTNGMGDLLLENPESSTELLNRLFRWQSGAAYYRAAAVTLAESLRNWTWDEMAKRIAERMEQDQ